ncbi:MAG: DUF3850 domain-containing protein [Brevundimonas sp.]|uniref:DUF3850 domain-containing protein n=1 Tax=Brevundimonas sp. TaxID=1871086 RepID=UPI0040335713
MNDPAARAPIVHELRTWIEPYDAIAAGLKPWELRFDDRDFQVGDTLRLRRFDHVAETYTGEQMERRVVWIMRNPAFGTQRGFVIMTLAVTEPPAWRCFHCNETFTSEWRARQHFGANEDAEPACIIAGADGGLLEAMRRAEASAAEAWGLILSESTEAAKAYMSLVGRHAEQNRAAEQAGYDRGIADAKAHPETIGLRPAASPAQPDLARDAIRSVVHEAWQLLDDTETGADGAVTVDQERFAALGEAMAALEAMTPDSEGPFWGGFPVTYFWPSGSAA